MIPPFSIPYETGLDAITNNVPHEILSDSIRALIERYIKQTGKKPCFTVELFDKEELISVVKINMD